jgi:hypothetical protein
MRSSLIEMSLETLRNAKMSSLEFHPAIVAILMGEPIYAILMLIQTLLFIAIIQQFKVRNSIQGSY